MFLIIDNYDSFVFNLADYVHQTGQETHIILNDNITLDIVDYLKPTGIFISPGPKHPKDNMNIIHIIQKYAPIIPIFGICLGHQAIGYAFGATVAQVNPAHGYTSSIIHSDMIIFNDIKQNISVGRYHSLAIIKDKQFPTCLKITAYTDNNLIMAVKHKTYPTFGVQFHPESILTPDGLLMIQNFIKFCYRIKNI